MKYNRDGTRYEAQTIIEEIEQRCAQERFPRLSDLLGSDWGFGKNVSAPEDYKNAAVETAKAIYA